MIHFVTVDTYGKVFRHFTTFHRFDTNCFQGLTEINQFGIVI